MKHTESGDDNLLHTSIPNKPSIDKREYRCITLLNEMKITLISDLNTDKCAVAMDVNIGSLSDPMNVMGLAHFCEHMVFMGSTKYPETDYYAKYLSQNNGEYNAYTSCEHTNFYFEINPENLNPALDIFAQFFISPLFTESATDLELQAVNSEHEKNICNDFLRCLQLDRYLCDKTHDYNKFPTGNIKTLKDDPELNEIIVHQELLNFHSRFYSSNIMSLCVLGKDTLDNLQSMVIEMFSPVLNKNVHIPSWPSHPWTDEYMKQIIYITPIKECYSLYIMWPIPDHSKLYQSKPGHYVSHLIGHEGPGSILALLKKRGWSNKLCVGPNYIGNGFGNMFLTIDLYEEGMNHIYEIITIIYEYIAILKSHEPQEWIFNEEKKLKEMEFQFKESSHLRMLVSQISADMSTYDSDHILQGHYLMTEFKPDLIKNIIDCLVPTNMRIFCISKTHEPKCNLEEFWYKTKYGVEHLSKDHLEMWKNVQLNSNLFLPGPNLYIPSDFTIKSPNDDNAEEPELLRDNALSRWWFSQDNYYLLPKGFIFINLSNTLSIRDPVSMVMNWMIVDLFLDAVNEDIYDADLANLEFGITANGNCIKMQFSGYNEKMPVYVNDIVTKLATFIPDGAKFESIKMNRFRIIRNFDMDRPLLQADKLLSSLMAEVMWTQEDLLSTTNDITLDKFLLYFKVFFSQFHTEALIYGNFKSNEAFTLMNDVDMIFGKHFSVKHLLKSQLTIIREVLLPENSNYVFHYNNAHHPTSVLITYLQTQEQTCRNNVIIKLCDHLITQPLFNQLRTNEQLGYIVGCNIKMSNSMQGHRIYLQSIKKPVELDDRVNQFLINFQTTLKEMSEEDYQKYVESLRDKILERPKDMAKLANKYWSEIYCKHYNFKRDPDEAEELKKLSKDDVIEYYQKFVDPNSKHLKKLSIYVTPDESHGLTSPDQKGSTKVVIDDIVHFKKSLPLSPLIESVIPPVKVIPTAKL